MIYLAENSIASAPQKMRRAAGQWVLDLVFGFINCNLDRSKFFGIKMNALNRSEK
jgi:hypothetical protein